MRITSKVGGLAVAVAATLALAGCVQPPPHVIPTAAPSAAPVFKSDAEALAAAEQAYSGYLAASDAVAHEGGRGANRMTFWDSSSQLRRDEASFQEMRSEGQHTTGVSAFADARLQSSTVSSTDAAHVVVYLCIDISRTKLLDSTGADVGKLRTLISALEVTFTSGRAMPSGLVVDRSVPWDGADFCS